MNHSNINTGQGHRITSLDYQLGSLMQQQPLVTNQHQQLVNIGVQTGSAAAAANAAVYQKKSQQQQQQPQPLQASNDLIGYYFGSISRETAEWIIKKHGKQLDGSYLLRSSGPNDDFVLSLMVVSSGSSSNNSNNQNDQPHQPAQVQVLHYKIVETEDSFVALHGQIGDEKFSTIDELIDKAQGVATKPKWPILRHLLETEILPPTYWGLTVDQVRLAILLKAKQWGFPILSSLMSSSSTAGQPSNQFGEDSETCNDDATNASCFDMTTLNNETIRTLIYKSLHEFQPWYHGKVSREEAERRIEQPVASSLGGTGSSDNQVSCHRDGRFLVRERDNYSYAICISHKRTTKHYRIDVLSTGEIAIQDGRRFTSLMALISHYTIMSDGLWCALTEPCIRPIQPLGLQPAPKPPSQMISPSNNLYCVPPNINHINNNNNKTLGSLAEFALANQESFIEHSRRDNNLMFGQVSRFQQQQHQHQQHNQALATNGATNLSFRGPLKEWLQSINHKWSQLKASGKSQVPHYSLQSFLFGNQNPLNNHCKNRTKGCHHHHHAHGHHHHHHDHDNQHNSNQPNQAEHRHSHRHNSHRRCKNGHEACKSSIQQHQQPHHTLARFQSHDHPQRCSVSSLRGPDPSIGHFKGLGGHLGQSLDHNQPLGSLVLSQLPTNCGFALNSQSFVGSPLFAVKTPSSLSAAGVVGAPLGVPTGRNASIGGSSGTTNSGGSGHSGGGNSVGQREEKLISPAQSICGSTIQTNNNPYKLNSSDIYGSQVSTAIVNNNHFHNNNNNQSNSSSSGNQHVPYQLHQHQINNIHQNQSLVHLNHKQHPYFNLTQQSYVPPPGSELTTISDYLSSASRCNQKLDSQPTIMCGQHAGSAFRYSNYSQDSDQSTCMHRMGAHNNNKSLMMNDRACRRLAADDLLVANSASRLDGPAAMGKFVQFQDGQCLRTHRDARSIQMAYLSSRKAMDRANLQHPSNDNQGVLDNSMNRTYQGHHFNQPKNGQNNHKNNNNQDDDNSIDLMQLNSNENSTFEFKYDPKLIKSSSIESLFGVNEPELEPHQVSGEQQTLFDSFDNDAPLANFKTNSELLMSLQSCLFNNNQPQQQQQHQQHQFRDILHPLPAPDYSCNMVNMTQSTAPDKQLTTGEVSIVTTKFASDGRQGNNTFEAPFEDKTNKAAIHNGQPHSLLDENMKHKHNLDELTTALLAELTASLKAQVDLKNKRAGLTNPSMNQLNVNVDQCQSIIQSSNNNNNCINTQHQQANSPVPNQIFIQQQLQQQPTNSFDLLNEFDRLKPT